MEKKYIEIDIADLVPYERNPRRNDMAVESVAESIDQVGYITPIVRIQSRTAGEERLAASLFSALAKLSVFPYNGC